MKNEIIIDGKRINLSNETIAEIKRKLLQKDYSKFVGMTLNTFAIKGKTLLKSKIYNNEISYCNENRGYYKQEIYYEIINTSKLKCGEIVCTKPNTDIEDLHISDFCIYMGQNIAGNYVGQRLINLGDIESMSSMFIRSKEVVRFKIK